MINNKQSQALEISFEGIKTLVISRFGHSLLKYKADLMKFGVDIPDSLIRDMELFILRNNLSESEHMFHEMESDQGHPCCSLCLKAHALKKGKENGLTSFGLLKLSNKLTGNLGHIGYYLDGDRLVKI